MKWVVNMILIVYLIKRDSHQVFVTKYPVCGYGKYSASNNLPFTPLTSMHVTVEKVSYINSKQLSFISHRDPPSFEMWHPLPWEQNIHNHPNMVNGKSEYVAGSVWRNVRAARTVVRSPTCDWREYADTSCVFFPLLDLVDNGGMNKRLGCSFCGSHSVWNTTQSLTEALYATEAIEPGR